MPKKITPTNTMIGSLCALAAKGKGRAEIAKRMKISYATLARWISQDEYPEIKKAYLEAKQTYAQDLAERLVQIVDDPLPEDNKRAHVEIQRRRLKSDNIKWITSKLLPKVYGDNLKINHEHSGEVAISPLAQLRQLEQAGPVIDVTPTEDDCF